MRTYLGVLLAVLLIASSGVGSVAMSSSDDSVSNSMMECDFPVTRTDATGTKVTVEQIPNRVVVLAPSTAQTMWEIGAKDIVVGMPVNKYTAYLEGYQKRTNVVNARGIPVIEKVIEANPDLVLAANIITDNTVQTLREENITVYKFRMASSIQDIMNKTMLTGRLTGRCNGAHSTVEWMKQKLSVVREAVKGENRPSIFYHLGAGWTAGEGSFIHRVIQIAGGHNIAAEANLSGAYG
ncbi:MAG: ABC transporter substrate-binding protein, partial [Halobacteriaceae archaeon]